MMNARSLHWITSLVLALFFAIGCGSDGDDGEDSQEEDLDECTACIESGGTWQPEVEECTQNCDIMDISCYTDGCPGECEDSCGYCFGQQECEDQGCTWNQEAEAMWCS